MRHGFAGLVGFLPEFPWQAPPAERDLLGAGRPQDSARGVNTQKFRYLNAGWVLERNSCPVTQLCQAAAGRGGSRQGKAISSEIGISIC